MKAFWLGLTAKTNTPNNITVKPKITFPSTLDEFVAQENVVDGIKVSIDAAVIQGCVLKHILLYGPAGTGKSTLARLIAHETGANITTLSAASIANVKEIEDYLFALNKGDILFIDEIHALKKRVADLLLPAIEDFVVNGQQIEEFTFIGGTTDPGAIIKPLMTRFTYLYELTTYTAQQLLEILVSVANEKDVTLEREDALYIAHRSFGTPRIAKNILQNVINLSIVKNSPINEQLIDRALLLIKGGLDSRGLDRTQRTIMQYLIDNGVTGEKTLCSMFELSKQNLEIVERPLLQIGFLFRTPKGRVITKKGIEHLMNSNI
jgi:Holliday junction DNA helicase RuvB